jgi:kynurenine formamidase
MTHECDLLDLSVPLGPGPGNAVPVEIEYMSHAAGGEHLARLVGTTPECLCGGKAWASERVSAITHSGTHVDAPFHYSAATGDRPSRTIDEIPLDWFWGPGKKIVVEPKTLDRPVAVEELVEAEEKAGMSVEARDIVLFDTGAQAYWDTAKYNRRGRGLSPALVRHLVDRGVCVFGTDAWSVDPPYWVMRRRMKQFGTDTVWSAHYVGREYEFCAIEKLANLALLPAQGFHVAAFPIKIAGGSAGWARVVGFVPRKHQINS